MNQSLGRYIGIGVIFLIVLVSGYALSRTGKPYGALLFNLHKLIALGGVVFLGVTAAGVGKIAPLTGLQVTGLVVSGTAFLSTIVSGGLVSVLAEGGLSNFSPGLQTLISSAHKVLPYLTVLSTAWAFYLLVGKG